MVEFYSAFKAFHIIAVITWMAALFYLPRLFVYHAMNYENAEFRRIVEVQEKKLYCYIGYPAMFATLISGALLIFSNIYIFKSGGWLHAKLLLVTFLLIFHFFCGHYRKQLLLICVKSEKFFRIFNEIPTFLMIFIVILAVCKPF